MSSLDAFNLDDMFAEGGDALFGFDQDLMGGMDDIVDQERQGGNNGNAAAAAPAAPAPPPAMPSAPASKRSGPRTKKSNPMIPEEESAKKGRGKRKAKAPPLALEEDIELIEDGPRKKRKASLKSKGGKAELDAGGKSKKKKGSAAQAKQSKAGFVPSVPAVGQFGARATSSKFKKTKKKGAPGGEEPPPPPTTLQSVPSTSVAARPPPKQESTFCGLQPSKTVFYPFMEAVPAEPNLKNKKLYPGFDKISNAFTNAMVKPGDKLEEEEFSQGLSLDSPIFELLQETFEAISDKEKQNFNDEKKDALLKTIPQVRKFISKYDRQKVITDVYALLGLLGRQYNFLKTSLDNMQAWCQAEFTPQDFKATYDINESSRATKQQRWKKQIVTVHVACPGHREPTPLTAILPQSVVIVHTPAVPDPPSPIPAAPPAASASAANTPAAAAIATTTTTKKKTTKPKPPAAPAPPPVPAAPKTYAESSPHERRSMIAERVTMIVSELQEKHRQNELKQEIGSKKPFTVTEDETLSTQRMWDFMEYKGFHKTPSTSLLSMQELNIRPNKVVLADPSRIRGYRASTPQERKQQQVETGKVPESQQTGQGDAQATGHAVPSTEVTETKQQKEADDDIRISSNSLFDRLQSLLVDEDDDENDITEAVTDSDDDSSSNGEDESLGFLDEPDEDEGVTDPMKAPNLPVVDLSNLSLEERTFIHLCKTGLIGTRLYPKAQLVLSSAEGKSDEHDLSNVIGSMAEDLSEITAKNNARVQFLETAVAGMDLANSKNLEDQQNSLITKCQNLIKRNKEKAKKHSSKKKDDLNLPW